MKYQFPIIRTIDDVLPYVSDRKEFIVAERDYGTIVNYVIAMADTFNMNDPDDLAGAIRRECRGLIFARDGNLMSRPFHKFFNVNEREETQAHVIDVTRSHVIMEKMDGSMIRPLLIDGRLRLGTKMGVTSVAMGAEAWLARQDRSKKDWLIDQVKSGMTPLFEWISRDNQVVIEYEEPDLVYLGSRVSLTGEYVFESIVPFTQVPRYGKIEGNFHDYIARQRESVGREGDIIRFNDGHMLKVKNDWYVRIHKAIDRVSHDQNIVDLILCQGLDDVIAMLPESEASRVKDVSTRFTLQLLRKEEEYDRLWNEVKEIDHKTFSLQHAPSLEPQARQYVYGRHDGKKSRDLLLSMVQKSVGNTTRWESCAEWLKL